MREHPIAQFLAAGIRCTVSTDDPMLFGNQLNDDYLALAAAGVVPPATLVQIAKNGFAIADLTFATKQHYLAELDIALACAPAAT
jgi:adenosine deaminase